MKVSGRRICCLAVLLALQPGWAITLPADARVTPIHPGASMFRIRRTNPAMAIDGFVWRRDDPRLAVAVTAGKDQVSGLEATSRQIGRLATVERRPIAAVNGDFYQMTGGGAGATIGLFVKDGELLSLGNDRPAFTILSDGTPAISSFKTSLEISAADGAIRLQPNRLNNDRGPNSLVLYTPGWAKSTQTNDSGVEVVLRQAGKLTPNYRRSLQVAELRDGKGNTPIPAGALVLSGHGTRADALRKLLPGVVVEVVARTQPDLPVRDAIGAWPILTRQGKLAYEPKASEPKHPRTAIGFDGEQVVAVTIDGRRAGHSVGMTLPELASFMFTIGCQESVNLDGGGSTTCWVRGSILNRPSDGRERSVANALALLAVGRLGAPANISFDPPGPLLLAPGTRFQPTVRVTDSLLNPLTDPDALTLSVEGNVGRLSDGVLQAAAAPATGRIVARSGAVSGALDLTIVDRVAKLLPEPSVLQLLPGASAGIAVEGVDAQGREVLLPADGLQMAVEGDCGKLAGATFTAAGQAAAGSVVIRGFGAEVRVPVRIAGPELVESFEAPLQAVFEGFPADAVQGSLTQRTGDAATGQGYAHLVFQLGDQPTTRAAYLKLDRQLGAAMALRAQVRGDGQRVWLRVAVRDGNGIRETYTLYDGTLGKSWTAVQCDLPEGIKEPVTWESVYVVTLKDGATATAGWVDWDQLEVVRAAPKP